MLACGRSARVEIVSLTTMSVVGVVHGHGDWINAITCRYVSGQTLLGTVSKDAGVILSVIRSDNSSAGGTVVVEPLISKAIDLLDPQVK